MKKTIFFFSFLLTALILSSCKKTVSETVKEEAKESDFVYPEPRPIVIQPIGGFPEKEVKQLQKDLQEIIPNVSIAPEISIYTGAFVGKVQKYRADSLLTYINKKTYRRKDAVVLGVTIKDIVVSKNNYSAYGVLGLARTPGDVCIVSSRRLPWRKDYRQDMLFKIAIHELAHTEGLEHCEMGVECCMKSSQARRYETPDKDFCITCKTYLINRGWRFKSVKIVSNTDSGEESVYL